MNILQAGIVSYGAYLPANKILGSKIQSAQGRSDSNIPQALGVIQKSVPDCDEDTITLAVQAAYQALERDGFEHLQDISTLFVGSESHPYAVKPSASVIQTALGLSDHLSASDLQFACKAGTQALQLCASYIEAKLSRFGLAIGADTAQSRPGDVLEYTAGAGAAAFLMGRERLLAKMLATCSVTTDTPDFWRRPSQKYPEHAGRFSGEPGYFSHVRSATLQLLDENNLKPKDIDWCIFHSPNAKFPQQSAHQLGFTSKQLSHGLLVQDIGNTYAASSLLSLAHVLDQAQANQTIVLTSYGSGSGADAFLFETTALLITKRRAWNTFISEQAQALGAISYREYRLHTDS